jgi:hypothetical protein
MKIVLDPKIIILVKKTIMIQILVEIYEVILVSVKRKQSDFIKIIATSPAGVVVFFLQRNSHVSDSNSIQK